MENVKTSCAIALAVMLGCGSVASAATEVDCENPRKAEGSMSEALYRGVEEATKLMGEEKYAEAVSKLKDMTGAGSDYEKAIVYYNLGFAYSSQNDYARAAEAFAKTLSFNAMPQKQHEQLQYNLGQLYLVAGKPDEGITTLQKYIAESCAPVPADAHLFLANALAERKRYKEALPQIDLALSKADKPKESWLQLKLAIQYELRDLPACAETLVQLVGVVSDKADYWNQLSSIFLELKKDTRALAVLALAERKGLISRAREYRNMYSIYMMLDLPFKAGLLYEDAIRKGSVPEDAENLESLANAWINAREAEKAEAALVKLATVSDNGEHYFRLGAIYGDGERWKESTQALRKALNKGGLKHAGQAWMRLAVAQYNLKDNASAQAALKNAINYDETRKQASEWLRHLQSQAAAGASDAASASAG